MYWDEKTECMSRDEMAELQGRKLVKLVKYVYENSPFYTEKFDKIGLLPGDIKGIEDISKIPFTTKEELRENYLETHQGGKYFLQNNLSEKLSELTLDKEDNS